MIDLTVICLFPYSDGGFLSHNAAKDTYPQPIPTKKVIFPAQNGSAQKDVSNHTENDLPVYNDYMVGTMLWYTE